MTEQERKQSILDRFNVPRDKVLPCVFDSDTKNEIDDQYALAYILRRDDRFDIQALYAEPYFNNRGEAKNPGEGMEQSYEEILRVLQLMNIECKENFVFKGATHYIESREKPEHCPAALDLIERAKQYTPENPLYVIATGCISNVGNALLIAPEIRDNIVVCWLGGHQIGLESFEPEFNLVQDVIAAREVFSCGTAVIQSPCQGVVSHLLSNIWELEHYLAGRNKICDYLLYITREYLAGRAGFGKYNFAQTKVLWDLAPIAHLVNPDWFRTEIVKAPGLKDDGNYIPEMYDHPMLALTWVKRDAVIGDMFKRIVK